MHMAQKKRAKWHWQRRASGAIKWVAFSEVGNYQKMVATGDESQVPKHSELLTVLAAVPSDRRYEVSFRLIVLKRSFLAWDANITTSRFRKPPSRWHLNSSTASGSLSCAAGIFRELQLCVGHSAHRSQLYTACGLQNYKVCGRSVALHVMVIHIQFSRELYTGG